MSSTTTISRLRVGQRFSWIPAAWYGPCRLTSKTSTGGRVGVRYYDLKYDARVVNPPGVVYGVAGKTRVRLLKSARGVNSERTI